MPEQYIPRPRTFYCEHCDTEGITYGENPKCPICKEPLAPAAQVLLYRQMLAEQQEESQQRLLQ